MSLFCRLFRTMKALLLLHENLRTIKASGELARVKEEELSFDCDEDIPEILLFDDMEIVEEEDETPFDFSDL